MHARSRTMSSSFTRASIPRTTPFDTYFRQAWKQTLPPSDQTLYYTSATV